MKLVSKACFGCPVEDGMGTWKEKKRKQTPYYYDAEDIKLKKMMALVISSVDRAAHVTHSGHPCGGVCGCQE